MVPEPLRIALLSTRELFEKSSPKNYSLVLPDRKIGNNRIIGRKSRIFPLDIMRNSMYNKICIHFNRYPFFREDHINDNMPQMRQSISHDTGHL